MALAIFIVLMLVLSSVYIIISNIGDSDNSQNSDTNYTNDPEFISALAGTNYPVAVIETSKGAIAVELYTDIVPNTCQNFMKYVNDGFYDGLYFHRIKDDFMIQGGGYTAYGQKKEATYNPIDLEINPDLKHEDGSISMARQGDPNINSATSEFFICDGAQRSLDDDYLQQYGHRGYAVFGKTIYGLDVVHTIAEMPLNPDRTGDDGSGWPSEDVQIIKAYMTNE